MGRNLDRIQADVYCELRTSVDDIFGMDTESWRELNIQQTMAKIADRTGIRAMFGLTLCRDQSYLRNLSRFNIYIGTGTLVTRQVPPLIRATIS